MHSLQGSGGRLADTRVASHYFRPSLGPPTAALQPSGAGVRLKCLLAFLTCVVTSVCAAMTEGVLHMHP